jgi:DHA2 family multidrug resistance protein
MALLDTSIVNASLPVIQGEIGATPVEGTWVGTSYLVAETLLLPLTSWLERMLGLRRLLLIGASAFTLFSVVCGMASDLPMMIFGRIGQGLAGGSLIPTALTLAATRLPPAQQSIGIAILAGAAMIGPIVGPVLGGWITETYSWHVSFFINVPICAGLLVLLMVGVPKSRQDWSELRNADWLGIAGMMIGLGCLTVLLEEGHREQWFESTLICRLAIAAAVGFALIAAGQLIAKKPVIKLSLLRNPTVASTNFLIMVVSGLLYGTLFAIPQFLAAVAGYNALQSGEVVVLCGITSVLGAGLYPVLVPRIDPRIVIGVSIVTLSIAAYMTSHLTSQSVGDTFTVAQLLQGIGMTLAALTLQQLSMSGVALEDAGDASSLFVVFRNLGGSIALAALASFQDQRLELHHSSINMSLHANDPRIQDYFAGIAGFFGPGQQGTDGAYQAIDGQVMLDALVMSFNDLFVVLTIGLLSVLPLVALLRPPAPGQTVATMMH